MPLQGDWQLSGLAGQPPVQLRSDAAVPLLNNGIPSDAIGPLLKPIRNQYPRAKKRRFAMANPGINHEVAPHELGFRHRVHVWTFTNVPRA
jgi:hypothetical protein